MNFRSISCIAIALILGICLVPSKPALADVSPVVAETTALHVAFTTLARADHDYKGHRAAAMNHIERACKLLGSPVKGGGKGEESQGVSDAQLKSTQGLLQNARTIAAANNQKQVLAQIDLAISELNTALSIK